MDLDLHRYLGLNFFGFLGFLLVLHFYFLVMLGGDEGLPAAVPQEQKSQQEKNNYFKIQKFHGSPRRIKYPYYFFLFQLRNSELSEAPFLSGPGFEGQSRQRPQPGPNYLNFPWRGDLPPGYVSQNH
jgi:hypothetical protein